MVLPNPAKPVVIPLLAHCGFKSTVQKFLRGHIQQRKEYLVPFQLLSAQVVVGKKKSMKDALYNRLTMQKSWSWITPAQSPCKRFAQEHPNVGQLMVMLPLLRIS